ncbi:MULTISPECIES: beta-phosphoglucomutase [Listeria]|uniref:beta-phosphoglucomutase n=1 Tax=Listeria TaxID=1637 RepID=UPI000B58F597|nr:MULTISPECIES: beta-phosphoglucomutase [Listeria]
MIKGVIFDLDGVITDTAEYHYQAWKALGDKIGIEINRTFNEQLKGVSRQDSLERILTFGGKEAAFSVAEKEDLMAWKNDFYVSLIQNITPDDVLPGVLPFLERLNENGIKKAIASASKNATAILTSLHILEEFDYVVDASLIARSKPDPEVFLEAIKGLNLTATECIGIEDAEAGVAAIQNAGMTAVSIGTDKSLQKAEINLQSTEELSQLAL